MIMAKEDYSLEDSIHTIKKNFYWVSHNQIIDLINKLDGKRYISIGGMFDSVPHTKPLPVTGSYKGWIPPSPLDETLKSNSSYVGPTSMTSQLSQILNKKLSIETLSLMVHIPLYIKL